MKFSELSLDMKRLVAEKAFLLEYITKKYPTGFVSYVADSFDYYGVLTRILPSIKEEIMMRNGRLVVRPDCYDEKTLVLTDSGFKFFKDLLPTDLVAQVLEDGSYEFVKPLKYVAEHYEGDMVRFKDGKGKLDLLVTPNHRMIYTRYGKEIITEAKDMPEQLHHYHHFARSAKAKEDMENNLTWKQRLAIAFQADGSFCTGCVKTKIRFSFSKERKISRILNIISKCGYDAVVYDLKDGKKEIHTKVDFDINKDFSWVDTHRLTAQWCRDFIEEVSYWDAHRRSDARFKVDSTTKSVIDVIELVALSAGYGVHRVECEDTRKDIFSNVHTLHIMKNNKLGGQAYSKEIIENFSGMVYCVQVPTGRIVVKRNSCVLVCGNSGDPVKVVAGYTWNGTDYQLEDEAYDEEACYGYEAVKINGKFYRVVERSDWTQIDTDCEIPYHEAVGSIQVLWEIFGGEVNSKGYKVLDSHIGMIYGDSITVKREIEILKRLKANGFASSNIVFGVGSFTYQFNTRDTFGIAVKATGCFIDDYEIMVSKEPKTDPSKRSAKGFIKVVRKNGILHQVDNISFEEINDEDNLLQPIFRNGNVLIPQVNGRDEDFNDIRARLDKEVMNHLIEVK